MVHGENYQDFKINKTKIIMSIPCQTYVQVVQSEDLCNGETKPAGCIIDSSLYSELGLEENSTQQQINQALYLAFLNLKTITENLQTQIDSL